MDWCVRREDDIEFKMRLHRKPAPTKYYQFLKWVSRNSKLPEHVRVMAESEIANLKLREYDRALYLPKSYSKFEVLLEKIKHRLSEMKQ